MFRTVWLIPLSFLALTAAEPQWPDVPDPIGLGPRLATIDWLQERKVVIPADATDAQLIELWAEASGLRAQQHAEEVSRREAEENRVKAERLERERIASEQAVALALANDSTRQEGRAPTGALAASGLISLDGGKITFAPPPGFTRMPQDILDLKYPSGRAPKYVVTNPTTGTTIAYDLKPSDVPFDQIEEARKAFAVLMPRIVPGLRWKENRITEISGVKWIHFEMITSAVDTDIHNIMLITGYKKQMLLFNFNSTLGEFPAHERALRESISSITIRE